MWQQLATWPPQHARCSVSLFTVMLFLNINVMSADKQCWPFQHTSQERKYMCDITCRENESAPSALLSLHVQILYQFCCLTLKMRALNGSTTAQAVHREKKQTESCIMRWFYWTLPVDCMYSSPILQGSPKNKQALHNDSSVIQKRNGFTHLFFIMVWHLSSYRK